MRLALLKLPSAGRSLLQMSPTSFAKVVSFSTAEDSPDEASTMFLNRLSSMAECLHKHEVKNRKKPETNIEAYKLCVEDATYVASQINNIFLYLSDPKDLEWYILDDDMNVEKAASPEEGCASSLANTFVSLDRIVAEKSGKHYEVRTSFLGCDHRLDKIPDDRPVLFETMVFEQQVVKFTEDEISTIADEFLRALGVTAEVSVRGRQRHVERRCTYDTAVVLHEQICEKVRQGTLFVE